MKWVTRARIRVNRTATAWLIRRFVDPAAVLLFVEADEVAAVQAREGPDLLFMNGHRPPLTACGRSHVFGSDTSGSFASPAARVAAAP